MTTEMIAYVAPAASFVELVQGQLTTTSVRVADFFGKKHSDVLRAIERIDCSRNFRRRDFALSSYKTHQNRDQPMYLVSRDGFIMLAMGFTGAKAAQIKKARTSTRGTSANVNSRRLKSMTRRTCSVS